jgi:hypothetical protein
MWLSGGALPSIKMALGLNPHTVIIIIVIIVVVVVVMILLIE